MACNVIYIHKSGLGCRNAHMVVHHLSAAHTVHRCSASKEGPKTMYVMCHSYPLHDIREQCQEAFHSVGDLKWAHEHSWAGEVPESLTWSRALSVQSYTTAVTA